MRTVVHQVGRCWHSSFHLNLRNDGAEYVQLSCVYFHVHLEILHLKGITKKSRKHVSQVLDSIELYVEECLAHVHDRVGYKAVLVAEMKELKRSIGQTCQISNHYIVR